MGQQRKFDKKISALEYGWTGYIIVIYYMASITSGEMADCDWLRRTFSSPLRNIGPRSFCTNLALWARSVQKRPVGPIFLCKDLALG
jgi:hypothetical protein